MTTPVTVRPARPHAAAFAVPLIQETIGHIGLVLTGAATVAEAEGVMLEFIARPSNRLSFQNVWIAQTSGEALGLLLGYAGADSEALDEPFREYLRGRNLPGDFLSQGLSGEWYIDTLAVTQAARGIGRRGAAVAGRGQTDHGTRTEPRRPAGATRQPRRPAVRARGLQR